MTDIQDSEEEGAVADNRICANCIGESFLKQEVERTGEKAACSYCEKEGKTISIGKLADEVESAFEDHFRVTSDQPTYLEEAMMRDSESQYQWEREGDPVAYVIADAVHVDEDPAEHVRQVLYERHDDFDAAADGEENPFDEDTQYAEKDPEDHELRASWSYLERSLKSENRMFNREAEATLSSIFEDLEKYKTRDGKSVIVEVGPGQSVHSFFRARVFQTWDKLQLALERPDLGLGPPPADLTVAGRMNARGISVFYGSTEPDIAVAEVRPPVGSRAVVARFEVLRPLRLLDVEALRTILVRGSLFDRAYISSLEKAKFLERLSHRITMPVMPEEEPANYLITQAIADYLAGMKGLRIDGIVFGSVQSETAGSNVVLFHTASRVKLMEIPEGTEITARLEGWDDDEPVPDYFVWETRPAPSEVARLADDDLSRIVFAPSDPDADAREPTLQADPTSVKVHHIRAVKFSTAEYDVKRHQSTAAVKTSSAASKPDDFDKLF